jgi:hypothetical protein
VAGAARRRSPAVRWLNGASLTQGNGLRRRLGVYAVRRSPRLYKKAIRAFWARTPGEDWR